MPVIRTEVGQHNGESWKKSYRVLRDGLWYINVPPAVARDMQLKDVTGKTMQEAEQKLRAVLAEHLTTKKTTCKVIYYQFEFSCYITKPAIPDEEHDFQVVLASQDISFTTGTAVSLAAEVYEETVTLMADGRRLYNYEHIPAKLPRGLRVGRMSGPQREFERPERVIDWTPEREAFFAQIGLALNDLIAKLHQLSSKPAALLKMADSGQKLLS